jgi:broad specificity phosphatase PhoE
MKKIYFVRHGESIFNTENREQGADGSLSDTGRSQAEFVAKRFHTIALDAIVSSPYTRAMETAKIINKELNKDILYSDFLIERRPPSKYIAEIVTDPEYTKIRDLMRDKRAIDPLWKYADEDNFHDLKTRAESALEYFHSLPYDSVLAVTHAGILRMIMASIIFGKELTYAEYLKIFHTFKVTNTGITLVEHRESIPAHGLVWRLIVWNDHAHLGELLP